MAYDTDLKKLDAVLAAGLPAMYEAHRDLYLAPPRCLGVETLADSGVNLRIVADVKEENVFAARRQLNRDVLALFNGNGIEIPFPQVVVHKA